MQPGNVSLRDNEKLYKQELYFDFISENPDYGPKAKMTISRTTFYRWLKAYALYKYQESPREGRDSSGRWIIFQRVQDVEQTTSLPI